ncbi:hypothetical protein GCM10025864_21830 [Luteimicrobium album]|uniref:Amidohydrolase n=1 Tax=Luteimicrobium album TaxID=1054550 RepID=A0ABQ6I3Q9_9MICO|nr:hypothetical protein [Luteimicrobium album]GMA24424.1 hypothetical protein GCM10025864_21830 [Luteimicrobium album]
MSLAVVDAHHHLWDLDRASYPWLEGPANRRYHGDDLPLRRRFHVEDYLTEAGAVEVVGAVHVEAGAADALDECRWVAAQAAAASFPLVHVARIDMRRGDVSGYLDRLGEFELVRGCGRSSTGTTTPC